MSEEQTARIEWHQLFGTMLQELLTPVGIIVETEVDVTSKPPRVDIVLLRRNEQPGWSEVQKQYLPDGIRTSRANHILLNFKYTESVNQEVFEQAIGYDSFYRNSQSLRREEGQSFVVSAKTPHQRTLNALGYEITKWPGVYRSKVVILQDIPLIVLNGLQNKPYNVFFKVFASRMRAKQEAITGLDQWWVQNLSPTLSRFLYGLLRYWFEQKEVNIMETLTAEYFIERGKEVQKQLLLSLLQQGEMQEFLVDTPYMRKVQEKGREEGREKGREEGHRAMSDTLHRILIAKGFQVKPGIYQQFFDQLTLDDLEQLSEAALKADSLTDFEAALEGFLGEK